MYTIETTQVFDDWFDALRDKQTRSRIVVRIRRAELGNFGDCKPVGEGVSEMRIHAGAGYRLYFKKVGNTWVILLAGGDKSTQQRDIETALALARTVKE